MPDKILIDTCVVLEDPDVIRRIGERGGIPFLAGTVLEELDRKKTGSSDVARAARQAFRILGTKGTLLDRFPDGPSLHPGDALARFGAPDATVLVLTRRDFPHGTTNDDRIVQIAQTYGMILLTRDRAMAVRAQALGVKAVFWTSPKPAQRRPRPGAGPRERIDGLQPFKVADSPARESEAPCRKRPVPTSADVVLDDNGQKLLLGKRVGGGGEGSIYDTSLAGQVAKIYARERLTPARKAKIDLMLTRAVRFPGLCWPSARLTDAQGEFVGYLMPKASGKTLQSAVFVKPVLEKTFPDWKRRDLVSLAIAFVDHMHFLHGLNVIVGDINPNNLLVTARSDRIAIVDTDSFQIEQFPCPVGTINFTAPDRQGMDYSAFLRTKEDDLFAVATMIFMILHPGKPPYSQQGGGTPGENIRSRNFPYWFRKNGEEFTGKDAPKGPWQSIWANLPWSLRGAFHQVFREGQQIPLATWSKHLRSYFAEIEEGRQSDELFPDSFPIRDPIEVVCGRCTRPYIASERHVAKLRQERKDPWCSPCHREVDLSRLARQSVQSRHRRPARPAPGAPASTYASYRPAPAKSRAFTPPPKNSRPNPTAGSTGCVVLCLLFIGSIVSIIGY